MEEFSMRAVHRVPSIAFLFLFLTPLTTNVSSIQTISRDGDSADERKCENFGACEPDFHPQLFVPRKLSAAAAARALGTAEFLSGRGCSHKWRISSGSGQSIFSHYLAPMLGLPVSTSAAPAFASGDINAFSSSSGATVPPPAPVAAAPVQKNPNTLDATQTCR